MFKRWWWVFLVMAFAGPLIGLGVTAGVNYMLPKCYESTAVVQVLRPDLSITDFSRKLDTGEASGEGWMTPQFFATELEVIKSRDALIKVARRLDLQTKWGQDMDTILRTLKRIVHTENIRGTALITIKVRHANPQETRDIAAEVAKAYKDYRNEAERKRVERSLEELKKVIRDQEDKVADKKKLLAVIADSKESGYEEAKKDYETEQDMLQQMKLKLAGEQIHAKIPYDAIIEREDPVIPRFAVSPNVTLLLVLGAVGGLLFSPLMAWPPIILLHRLVPARNPNAPGFSA